MLLCSSLASVLQPRKNSAMQNSNVWMRDARSANGQGALPKAAGVCTVALHLEMIVLLLRKASITP